MAEKQIDFPPLQKEKSWVAPFMLVLSLLCIVIVVIILTRTSRHRSSGHGGNLRVGGDALPPLRDL